MLAPSGAQCRVWTAPRSTPPLVQHSAADAPEAILEHADAARAARPSGAVGGGGGGSAARAKAATLASSAPVEPARAASFSSTSDRLKTWLAARSDALGRFSSPATAFSIITI